MGKAVVLLLIGLIIYFPTFNGEFQFDDINFITENVAVYRLNDLSGIWHFLSQPSRITCLYSFAINYHFHGLNPFGYHATNFIIHIINTFLIYWLVRLFCLTPAIRKLPNHGINKITAGIIAMFFMAHPGQTQAVSYISQRFASLATLFYILSICFYLKGRIGYKKGVSLLWWFGAICSAVLGMLTKEIVITLPLMIMFLEWHLWQGDRKSLTPCQKGAGLLVIIGLFAFIPAIFSCNVIGMLTSQRVSASHAGDTITLGKYLLTQTRVFWRFICLFFWPLNQNVDYDFPLSQNMLMPFTTLISSMAIGGYIWLAARMRKSYPFIYLGLAWVLVAFSANLIPRRHVIFEHKFYLISFGLCLIYVRSIIILIKKKEARFALLVLPMLVFSVLTFQRNKIWQTEIALWSDTIKKSPHKARPFVNLANAYQKKGKVKPALKYYNRALKNNSRHMPAYLNRGVLYEKAGKLTLALRDYNTIIAINPAYAKAYGYRGYIYRLQGKTEQAFADYNRALELDSTLAHVYTNRGILYKSGGDLGKALVDYNKALALNPDLVEALGNRGNLYRLQKQYDLALNDFNRAIALQPENPLLYMNRALVYKNIGEEL